jgi:5-methylcytosine-specific restriction endonuclease McrA
MASMQGFDSVSDQALIGQFTALVKQDQRVSAELLRYLDAIDRRQLWAKLGYSSLFVLCRSRFNMSEAVAGKRIGAMRTARRFPVLLSMVARGEIHLSGIQRLSAHLTADNQREVLAAAKHQSTRDIEKLVAELAPKPDVPARLRKLPEPRTRPQAQSQPQARVSAPAAEHSAEPQRPAASQPGAQVQPRRAPDPMPLSPRRYKLEVTLDQQAHDQLRQLQDLLAHQIANGDPAVIVKRALELLLADTLKKKTALTKKPRAQNTPRDQSAPPSQPISTPRGKSMNQSQRRSRAIPAQLKRQVWERDQGRCGFIGEEGHRCHETRGLEYAHLHPWAKGGGHSLDNLGLRCQAHNTYEAIQDYGAKFMQNKRRARQPVHHVREPARCYQPGATKSSSRLANARSGRGLLDQMC